MSDSASPEQLVHVFLNLHLARLHVPRRKIPNQPYRDLRPPVAWGLERLAEGDGVDPGQLLHLLRHLCHLAWSFRCRQSLCLGLVLTFLLVLTMTQVGTDLVPLLAFINLFFFDLSLTRAI